MTSRLKEIANPQMFPKICFPIGALQWRPEKKEKKQKDRKLAIDVSVNKPE